MRKKQPRRRPNQKVQRIKKLKLVEQFPPPKINFAQHAEAQEMAIMTAMLGAVASRKMGRK